LLFSLKIFYPVKVIAASKEKACVSYEDVHTTHAFWFT